MEKYLYLFTEALSYKLCMAFSVRKNFMDLPRAEESNPALSILYGVRTFCILMIIMDHRFGTYISGPMMNFDFIEKVCIRKIYISINDIGISTRTYVHFHTK